MYKNELRGLGEKDLLRAMEELEETWSETLLRGSDEALDEHTQRTRELEEEYLRRHPDRQAAPDPPAADRTGDDRPEDETMGRRGEGEKPGPHADLAGGEAGAVDREAGSGPDDLNGAYQSTPGEPAGERRAQGASAGTGSPA